MLAFGCNTVFTFYTLYLSLCSAFFLFDWQIAIISSKMVAPTLRHRIAIRLARGMHLSSAVQADVSTCSGVVRLLLLSLQLRKPSGIGLLWVVGRKFLFFPSLCLAIHLCFLSFTRYPCLIDPWNFRHSIFGLFWTIWCLRRRLIIKSDLLVSYGKFIDFWVSSVLLVILGAVPYFGFLADCLFFLSSETFGKPGAWGFVFAASVIFIFGWDP